MSDTLFSGKFIEEVEAKILENISNELFGVAELADEMNMSRSNLLRKIKKQTQLSASQFMRQYRLKKGMDFLEETELNVSEISDRVGFGNSSYFIKCFREQYGISPGEVRKESFEQESITRQTKKIDSEIVENERVKPNSLSVVIGVLFVVGLVIFLFFRNAQSTRQVDKINLKKSIAFLPFKNMSSDSSNLYFVNGLMESSLSNLQKIEDLRVISRTSVEKYRNTEKTISEIAQELNVSYLVEGSGQRIGDMVLLNVQLIEVENDTPIWAEQYTDKVVDVFSLQNEVAKKIADAIQAKVTPAELELIDKKVTDNVEAYDYYLQGRELAQLGTKEGVIGAITFYEKATEEDPQFALAYSQIAISYYYLDMYQAEKAYSDIINSNSDKALLYDPKSDISLISKALYYVHNEEYRFAVPHLEKALEYNPNSSDVLQVLSNLYARVIPNTEKYLKYALMGVQLDIAAKDSSERSFIYLHLGNAFIQTGFVDEAVKYINLSLDYNPNNFYSPFLNIFIQYAQHLDIEKTTNMLVSEWQKDTTRMDILQEVAKFHFFQEKYEDAYSYYKRFVEIKEKGGLNIYPEENLKIGMVYEAMGMEKEAANFYKQYAEYCENDESIYQPASLASKYAHEGKLDEAIEQLNIFASKNHFQYWILLFSSKDPVMKRLKDHPGYKKTTKKIEARFWENHKELKSYLEENSLL